ncbi:hypothetical protein AADW59_00875 [Candidatus Hodgkinia cicadicola]
MLYENKTRFGTECASYTVGLVLKGEQVGLIRRTRPALSAAGARVLAHELWVFGLTECDVKALLTRAQINSLVELMSRLNARLSIKSVLIMGHALIKAVIVLHKPIKHRDASSARTRAKKLALARQQVYAGVHTSMY